MMIIQSLNENSAEQLNNRHEKHMRKPFELNQQIENGTSGVEDKVGQLDRAVKSMNFLKYPGRTWRD